LGEKATVRHTEALGEAGFNFAPHPTLKAEQVIKATQAEIFPYDRNYFRTEKGLTESLHKLNDLWKEVRTSLAIDDSNIVQAREAAAMLATARWMYSSALERKETRGMHRHLDYPQQDADQQHYLISGGLDKVWVKAQPLNTTVAETKVKVGVGA
jgi:succinate dehydrogenase/fumarate reductase flavoprotein subunit